MPVNLRIFNIRFESLVISTRLVIFGKHKINMGFKMSYGKLLKAAILIPSVSNLGQLN